MTRTSPRQPTQRDLYNKATKALIDVQGGLRFCASCQTNKPAATFLVRRTSRGGVVRCADCAARRHGGRR